MSPGSADGAAAAAPRVSLLPVFLVVLVDVFGMTLVIPLLAIYAEQFGATALQATLLVSVFAVCQLVSGPIIGHASDRHGRRSQAHDHEGGESGKDDIQEPATGGFSGSRHRDGEK